MSHLLQRKLRSYQEQRALPITATQHTHIEDDALVVVLRRLAGEHATLHAFAVGSVSTGWPSKVAFVENPRDTASQVAFLRSFGRVLTQHVTKCMDEGRLPQIIVPTAAHAQFLGFIARRMASADGLGVVGEDIAETTALYGTVATHYAQRALEPGQQLVLSATGLLREHFAFGQDDGRSEHLSNLLHWCEAGPSPTFFEDLRAREEAGATGPGADPKFDIEMVGDFDGWYEATKAGDVERAKRHRRNMHNSFEEEMLRIWNETVGGVKILQARKLPEINGLGDWVATELHEMTRLYENTLVSGVKLSWRDTNSAQATLKLHIRDDLQQNWERMLLRGEPALRAFATLDGALVDARVVDVDTTAKTATLVADERWTAVRTGSTLDVLVDHEAIRARVRPHTTVWEGETCLRLQVDVVEGVNILAQQQGGRVVLAERYEPPAAAASRAIGLHSAWQAAPGQTAATRPQRGERFSPARAKERLAKLEHAQLSLR